jgi:nitric oxide reductase activation protein
MSLDEALFTFAWRLKRAVWRDRAHAAALACGVCLADLRAHLTLVARALSGAALDIQEAEHAGGFAGDVLYLPRVMNVAEAPEANVLAYLYRVAYTVTSRQLGCVLSTGHPHAVELTTLATLLAVPPTLAALEAELPMTRALRQRFFPLVLRDRPPCLTLHTPAALLEACTQVLLGRDLEAWRAQEQEHKAGWEWLQRSVTVARQGHGSAAARTLYASLLRSVAQKGAAPVAPVMLWGHLMPVPQRQAPKAPGETVPQTSLPTGTEQCGKAKEQVRQVELNPQDIENDVLVHTFEKVETAEEFCGVTRTPDGADELAQHAEALDALDLRDVVRGHTQTRSMYRADVTLDVSAGDVEAAETSATTRFLYDEWDGKERRYKHAWCRVSVTRPARLAASSLGSIYAAAVLHKHAKHVRDLRIAFGRLRAVRVLKNRQPDGGEVDIDALIDRYATVRSGHQPDDTLYLVRRRQRRDLVTLLLLDLSASTDAWIKGHRVLDVAKESLLVLGEVLSSYHDHVGIGGFYSYTRRDCRFVILKDFAEPWPQCKATLASVEPTGYTRIGPAIRHGLSLLQQQHATQKLLLLISDGKPTDYDRYEGRYGIADVRQAIREAGQARIHTYALAVDVQAKLYLPEMFGAGHYQILPHPSHLVHSLAQLYTRLWS